MLVNLYTRNHGKQVGIQDYIDFLGEIFRKRNHEYMVGEKLRHNALNIVIDEFSNYRENLILEEFRNRHPDVPMVLLLTEFFEKLHFVRSLNHFEGVGDSAVISLCDLVFRRRRNDFPPESAETWLKMVVYLPVLAAHGIGMIPEMVYKRMKPKKRERGLPYRVHRRVYLHMRYLGLLSQMKNFDAILLSHECILPGMENDPEARKHCGKVKGTIYPELDEKEVTENIFSGCDLYIEMTGSITPYRRKILGKIKRDTYLLGLNNVLGMPRAHGFGESAPEKRGAFSLHPPQTRKWRYSSPTRIYRSLVCDHSIPVITRHFGQNPIEDLCMRYSDSALAKMADLYFDREAAKEFLAPRIEAYNERVMQRNDRIVQELAALAER